MTTPNPLAKTKGAGTTFWMYTGNGDAFANPLSDTDWLRLAMVKDLQPGEMTADAEVTLISMMKMQTGKRQPRGRNPLVILRRRWPGVRVTAGRKNWFSCSTPVKSARFVSNIPTALLMFSVAG